MENLWYSLPNDTQERAVEALLGHYLHEDEVKYYMRQITLVAQCHKDAWVQAMQVIKDKEQQPKFKSGTEAYKRKSIIAYALKENLASQGVCPSD